MPLVALGLGNVSGCDHVVGLSAADATDALHKAANLTAQLNALMQQHPELQAAVDAIPGGALALHAIGAASKVLKYGHTVEHVVSKYGHEVAHAVSKILDLF